MARLWSCEEAVVLLATTVISLILWILFLVFGGGSTTPLVLGALTLPGWVFLTRQGLRIEEHDLVYRTALFAIRIPLHQIRSAGFSNFRAGIPGTFLVVVMMPNASVHGHHLRLGACLVPDRAAWLASLTAAIERRRSASEGGIAAAAHPAGDSTDGATRPDGRRD